MTAAKARDMADEQIAYWRSGTHLKHPVLAYEAWIALNTGRPYPGGGWERVRAAMIDWLLAHDAPARLAA